ncbi:hypothetical protein [Burkholderia vietnamiensis]|uniref:E1 N-terminal domain-containing protein n=2 Tax=Burkholderia vietnamiensis TaxID=60552 RepID=A0AAW7T999_BURVI|nr:hypothetical protein [Burkholderia vietnamiensis]MCA8179536.1 hypothetical protein [Burkholderia vietnamiensis]MDN7798865.1 hypothetical protein [Burkholderia vietnamiensis]UEC02753.1 hypothetical protein LK462_12340 [Burkholderia vietnamiensis]
MLSETEENLNTLMLLTGMSEDDATTLLRHRVRVTSSDAGDFPRLARDIRRLLERTLTVVGECDPCDLELGVGKTPYEGDALCLSLSDTAMTVRPREDGILVSTRDHIAGITRKACACFAAGFVLSRLVGASLPNPPGRTFELKFANIGLPVDEITKALDLKDAVLAGGGGVANGFLWALEELNPHGQLTIVDPKRVRRGNANRCLYFDTEDTGYKADLLAERVNVPNVKLTPFRGTLSEYVRSRPDKRLPLLISTADSRIVRRTFQNELPYTVFDASTTDVSELIVHSHEQPTENACLSCIYPHIEDEDHRDKHVAETLGLTLEEIQERYISQATAEKLANTFPQLHKDELVGMAYDSLHKSLCGTQALIAPGAVQAAAPFSFVSNLAGVLLALEMYRYQTDRENWRKSNYMFLSPWMPPHSQLRRLRPRRPRCEFCSVPTSLQALKGVWADKDWTTQS